jgi:hypothetical protein
MIVYFYKGVKSSNLDKLSIYFPLGNSYVMKMINNIDKLSIYFPFPFLLFFSLSLPR